MVQKFSRKELQRLGCTDDEIKLVMEYQRRFPIILQVIAKQVRNLDTTQGRVCVNA